MARTIKDIFCRYKTQQGYLVHRKAGWDTHGLPVELGVEKKLGITKEDIGRTISIEEYNRACRKAVMEFTGLWEELTRKMGYWVNMDDPYITYDNKYIETLWWLLKQLFDKGLLYKGYTIQPYSAGSRDGSFDPRAEPAGMLPRCEGYDLHGAVQGHPQRRERETLRGGAGRSLLPGLDDYALDASLEYGTGRRSRDRICARQMPQPLYGYPPDGHSGQGSLPFLLYGQMEGTFEVDEKTYKGSELAGIRYEQLIPWVKPDGDAFRVIEGDYVTTSDGTGIVHIAPTFGADDARVARIAGIAPLFLHDRAGKEQPMVDRKGRFFPIEDLDPEFVRTHVDAEAYGAWAGRYVKNAYDDSLPADAPTLDVDLSVALKAENKVFKIEKHTHSYPHCWRTDKPVLYYPLDSWFIRTTALRDRMIELNRTIHWKPESTGTGRFGKWLEGLVDWNLSRSRFWGPRCRSGYGGLLGDEMHRLGRGTDRRDRKVDRSRVHEGESLQDFKPGDMSKENYSTDRIDLHRPYVDSIVLVSSKGEPMRREPDLIDVWFDSGAMPYAQLHYPFEHSGDYFKSVFPADFIAEGVDQTRGWFFTLHAIATMLFDSVAFKNIISNGLVLDKNGNKMSKRLGNAVDPFDILDTYGPDATRWYMISNSQPWDNLKFDRGRCGRGAPQVLRHALQHLLVLRPLRQRGRIHGQEKEVPMQERPEIDRWIISLLNTLVKNVTTVWRTTTRPRRPA